MFSKPEYSLSVALPIPKKAVSLPSRLGSYWTREEEGKLVLTFNEVKGPKELKDIAQTIQKAAWAQTRPRPLFSVRSLRYNARGKRAPHWDDDEYTAPAKVVVDHCNLQLNLRKRKSVDMPTPNFNLVVEYADKHYFNGADALLDKLLKREASGGGMGMGGRDQSYDFATIKQVDKALSDLSNAAKVPFPVKVYLSQNVYCGRARWVVSNDLLSHLPPAKALSKFKELAALSPAR